MMAIFGGFKEAMGFGVLTSLEIATIGRRACTPPANRY
jgi:hypothetical protein